MRYLTLLIAMAIVLVAGYLLGHHRRQSERKLKTKIKAKTNKVYPLRSAKRQTKLHRVK